MLLKTLLNNRYKLKSFVYESVTIDKTQESIEVKIIPRKNSKIRCSNCSGFKYGIYDTLKERSYEFIPILGMKVFFKYRPRRINCNLCGVTVESVPWATGKNKLTDPFKLFLSSWARKLSWKEVSDEFKVNWKQVFNSVEYVVNYGLSKRVLSGIKSIGIDEIKIRKGHKYATVVYQIDKGFKRLLWVGEDRKAKTVLKFFRMFSKEQLSEIEHVCSDMWKAYLKVIKKKIPDALHILDRFHIVANMNKAMDKVRSEEAKKLKETGYEPVLTGNRWCFLKSKNNLTDNQKSSLKELLKYNLTSTRAYLLKEEFQLLWKYKSANYAGKFIDSWTKKVMYSKIKPLKKQAKSIRNHKELILNWFRAKEQLSSGIVEGFNNKCKVTIRKSYGFKSFKCLEIALYHSLGNLEEPKLVHKLW